MPGAMKRQATLLFRCFGFHEPHVRPANGLADCLCIGGIVLLPLHAGLHIGWRHQPNLVTERLQFTGPVMGRSASFDTDQTGPQLLEEQQYMTALQLTAQGYIAFRIDTVNLKDRLRDVETDRLNRLHSLAPPNRGASTAPTSMALMRRWRSRPQHQQQTHYHEAPTASAYSLSQSVHSQGGATIS